MLGDLQDERPPIGILDNDFSRGLMNKFKLLLLFPDDMGVKHPMQDMAHGSGRVLRESDIH